MIHTCSRQRQVPTIPGESLVHKPKEQTLHYPHEVTNLSFVSPPNPFPNFPNQRAKAMAYYDRRGESSILEAFTLSPLPYPVILILAVVTLLLGASWFFTYENFMEEAAEQFSWVMLAVPIALVLLIRWISSVETFEGYFGFYPRESRWRGYGGAAPAEGSSPWGVAMVVVLLLVLATYHSTFKDMWKP